MDLKELKKILEEDYAWGNLDAENNKWFINELLEDFLDILKKQLTLTNVVQQSEQYCENVIHHTCKHFDDIVGCDGCLVKDFEAK